MITVLFAAADRAWPAYETVLPAALAEAGLDVTLIRDTDRPEDVDYIVYAPNGTLTDFTPYANVKAVFSLWAGVEKIVGNATINCPLCRLVDPSLAQGMTEWVVGQVMRHHLGLDRYIKRDSRDWDQVTPPLASQRKVTILGIGELGAASARALLALGFNVHGWSNSQKSIDGVTCHAGAEGLEPALKGAEIVVLLLPDAPGTQNVINAETLAYLAQGAVIINPGRGPLIDDNALIDALNSGQLSHATLDVFRQEPLPQDHPFWAHPGITITPHVASETRPFSAAKVIAENMRRAEAGEALMHLVDRDRGY